MPDAIVIKNIVKCFPADSCIADPQIRNGILYALDDVSFNIQKGSLTIICGANGSGKSVLMSLIAGLEPADSGTVFTDGKTGLIFQEPESQILGETVREDISFSLQFSGLRKKEIDEKVNSILAQTALLAKAEYPARTLSGGEKRLLAVAGVLAMNADIIIFDEPYANMDYQSIILINKQIVKLKAEGKTILILTHEIEKCAALADSFIVMCKGKKVFDSSPASALEQDLEIWGIRNPLAQKSSNIKDLLWL